MKNLATVQKTIWLTQNIHTESSLFNVGGYAFIQGALNEPGLIRSIEAVLNDTDVISLGYYAFNEQPLESNAAFTRYDIASVDLSQTADPSGAALSWINNDMRQPFDVSACLLKTRIIKCSDTEYYWYAKAHHLIFDGYSMALFFRKVSSLYSSPVNNDTNTISAEKYPYASFIGDDQAYRSSDAYISDRSFWVNRLRSTPGAKAFQSCTSSPSSQSLASARKDLAVTQELYKQIERFCERYNATAFHYFISVILILNKYYGNAAPVIGLPVFNRYNKRLKNTIGTCVNTLPFSLSMPENARFSDLLVQVKDELKECYKHQRFPLYDILEEMNMEGNIYNITFSFQKNTYETRLGELESSIKYIHSGEQQEDLVFHLLAYSEDEDLTLSVDYRQDLYAEDVIDDLLRHFDHLLHTLLLSPDQPVNAISCMSPAEKEQLLNRCNAPQVALPQHTTIVELIEEQAALQPAAAALLFEDTTLSYAQLNEAANQFARYLRQQHHIQPGHLVGVHLQRSEWIVIAILAVLKAGGAYVPVDPQYPQERIDYIFSDAQCRTVIDQALLDDFRHNRSLYSSGDIARNPDTSALAYVIYTSGSTGKPKGVMITHHSVLAFIQWCRRHFSAADFDVMFAVTSICFDLSVFEICYPLTIGKPIRLLENALAIPAFLNAHHKILLNTVPSVVSALIRDAVDLGNVTVLNMAGEPVPARFTTQLDTERIQVRNLYGPSEDTTYSTVYRMRAGQPILIGAPIDNTRAYILGEAGQLLPMGVTGEICLAGDGLAKGYLNNPALTAEKFVPDPFRPGERMYKTGDLGRWLPDGNIAFLGRKDEQVKIRGYRIEPGEIESCLQNLPGITEAVVSVSINNAGEHELVAYLVAPQQLDAAAVREHLSRQLPSYMLPDHYVQLEALPLNANGKVDKKRLPGPQGISLAGSVAYVPPRNETEALLVDIWQDILGKEKIGINDSFFALGGHSLKAVRLASRIHQTFETKISLGELFVTTILKDQAALINRSARTAFTSILPAPQQADYPLSAVQRRLWILSQLQESNAAYNMPGAFILEGDLDVDALSFAFSRMLERHESLRTVFRQNEAGEPRQLILPADAAVAAFNIVYRDLRQEAGQQALLQQLVHADLHRTFDLGSGPLLHTALYQLQDERWALTYVMHHICGDGWSIEVFRQELFQLYNAFVKGGTAALPPLSIQYKDYACWQQQQLNEDVLQLHRSYWLKQLEGPLPVLELQPDKSRPLAKTYNGGRIHKQLPSQLAAMLKTGCDKQDATIFMGLLAIVSILLHRYSGQEEIVIGTPIAGRQHSELEGQIGCYLNTLALRLKLNDGISFNELLQHARQVTLGAYEHQAYPFDLLVDELPLQHDVNRNPIFDVNIVLQNTGTGYTQPLQGVSIAPFTGQEHAVSKFDLSFEFTEVAGGIAAVLIYNSDIYEAQTIARMADHLERLVETVSEEPTAPVKQLIYLSSQEQQQLLDTFNQTITDYPKDRSITSLFEEQVIKTPHRTAVVFEQRSLSYQQLDVQAGRLAAYLQQQYQVKPGDFVGIMTDRSDQMIIAVLAVLKAGAAYVPVEPEFPGSRKEFIINDAGIKTLITQTDYIFDIAFYTGKILALDVQADMIEATAAVAPYPSAFNDAAYIMYTSGSTGTPKGVLIEHRSVVRLVKAANYFDFHQDRSLLATGAFAFDATTFEYWGMLLNGGCLVLSSRETLLDSNNLAAAVLANQVNTLWLTTGWFNQLVDSNIELFGALSTVLMGGERISHAHVRALQERYPRLSIIHCYGPTENTTFSTACRVEQHMANIPIGKPISNTQVYILDQLHALVPIGIAGEICLGGDGLAREYLNNPALTAEKFVPNPFRPGERMYKTGDLGRWMPDGNIEFLGRKDEQVKIRGFRIEPGEIESCLKTCAGITDAVVTVKISKSGEKELAAYLVAGTPPDVAAIREHLLAQLPSYMLPDHYVQLDSLPLNANGKVDKKRLPDPEGISLAGGVEYIAPRNETEQLLAGIWREILGKDRVSVKDNFFDIGGHSLRATRLVSQIHKTFDVKIDLRDLFITTVLEDQAALISKAQKTAFAAITPVEVKADYPLSSAQRRLWVLSQLQESNVAYNMPGAYVLEGALDIAALSSAFKSMLERHESLRTIFRQDEQGAPRQVVLPVQTAASFEIAYKDLSQEPEETLQQHIREDFQRPFDLSSGPLLHAALYQLAAQRWVFTYVMHHICSDGWSMGIFIRELLQYYNAYVQGGQAPLTPLPIHYKDYACWQQQQLGGAQLQLHKSYWHQQLEGPLPVLELPLDKQRPAVKTYKGDTAGRLFDSRLTAAFSTYCRNQDTTLFMGLLAAVSTLLYRYSGQTDIIIGSPIAGRQHADLEGQIGFYLNTLALRMRLNDTPSFTGLLQQCRQVTMGAYEHQVYPFDQLIDELPLQRDLGRNALFDVMVVLQNNEFNFEQVIEAPGGLDIKRYDNAALQTSKFDLLFEFIETPAGLQANIRYNSDLYNISTIVRMAEHLERLLAAAVETPAAALAAIGYLGEDEKQLLLEGFSTGKTSALQHSTIIDLFEAQAAATPEATALVSGQTSLSYRQLDETANQLAAYLQQHQHIEPDDLAGILLDRSQWTVIAILAVLKAGGAYVPADPLYPEERIRYIFQDARCKTVIDQSALDDFIRTRHLYDSTAPQRSIQTSHLAYVIYTSGSTGKPKGVMIEHASIAGYILTMQEEYGITQEDKVLQAANIAFDAASEQVWLALCSGAALFMIDRDSLVNNEAFSMFIAKNGITHLHAVPSLLKNMQLPAGHSLKRVVSAGEGCPLTLAEKFRNEVSFYNKYGPTEATISATIFNATVNTIQGSTVPIGKPIRNYRVYILDERGALQPIGIAGEICIAGAGLARGYLHKPELTAEKFVPDPFYAGERMYRTGDLGRWLPDGNIEFIGRRDEQVKVRGYRIEPGEIESSLLAFPGISDAAVAAKINHAGEYELAAYLVAMQQPDIAAIREYLSQQLPSYMLPGYYVQLEALPLNANGKVDRKQLPQPEGISLAGRVEYIAPRNETEQLLAGIWQDILGKERIGVKDNFFDLGGHSLKAIQLVTRINSTFSVRLTIQSIFTGQTVENIAEQILFARHQSEQQQNRKKLIQIEI